MALSDTVRRPPAADARTSLLYPPFAAGTAAAGAYRSLAAEDEDGVVDDVGHVGERVAVGTDRGAGLVPDLQALEAEGDAAEALGDVEGGRDVLAVLVGVANHHHGVGAGPEQVREETADLFQPVVELLEGCGVPEVGRGAGEGLEGTAAVAAPVAAVAEGLLQGRAVGRVGDDGVEAAARGDELGEHDAAVARDHLLGGDALLPADLVVDLDPARLELDAGRLALAEARSEEGAPDAGEGIEDSLPGSGEELDDLAHQRWGLVRIVLAPEGVAELGGKGRLPDGLGEEHPGVAGEVVEPIGRVAGAGPGAAVRA